MKIESKLKLTNAEKIILGLGTIGKGILDVFLPQNYPEARFWRDILHLDKKASMRTTLWRLKRQGVVKKYKNGESELTSKGRVWYDKLKQKLLLREPKKWDGKWRITVFDIPETLQYFRKVIRIKLRELGFEKLQQSVWIGPQPLSDDFVNWLEERNLRKYLFFITVENIDCEEELRKLFDV